MIEQTIREKLPEGFQRAEFLRDKGMVDLVVHRHELRDTLSKLVRVLTKTGGVVAPKANVTKIEPPTAISSDEIALDKAAE